MEFDIVVAVSWASWEVLDYTVGVFVRVEVGDGACYSFEVCVDHYCLSVIMRLGILFAST